MSLRFNPDEELKLLEEKEDRELKIKREQAELNAKEAELPSEVETIGMLGFTSTHNTYTAIQFRGVARMIPHHCSTKSRARSSRRVWPDLLLHTGPLWIPASFLNGLTCTLLK